MSDYTLVEPAAASEDRTLPAIAYALYILAFSNGLTAIIGLILASANRASAGPRMASHYRFLINTFWMGIGWALIGGVLLLFGVPLSLVLVGIPFAILGGVILGLLSVWFLVRCILGAYYLAQGVAYPRPNTWLI